MQEILILATTIAPVTVAVVEVIKRTLALNTRYAPLLAVIVGLGLGAVSFPIIEVELPIRLWTGALAGLSAAGLYDVAVSGKGGW